MNHVYTIQRSGDYFVIVNGQELGGPYDTQEIATEAALDFAKATEIVQENDER